MGRPARAQTGLQLSMARCARPYPWPSTVSRSVPAQTALMCACALEVTGIHLDCTDCAFSFSAEQSGDCTERSYPLVLEAEPDQLCVPALNFNICRGES